MENKPAQHYVVQWLSQNRQLFEQCGFGWIRLSHILQEEGHRPADIYYYLYVAAIISYPKYVELVNRVEMIGVKIPR